MLPKAFRQLAVLNESVKVVTSLTVEFCAPIATLEIAPGLVEYMIPEFQNSI